MTPNGKVIRMKKISKNIDGNENFCYVFLDTLT